MKSAANWTIQVQPKVLAANCKAGMDCTAHYVEAVQCNASGGGYSNKVHVVGRAQGQPAVYLTSPNASPAWTQTGSDFDLDKIIIANNKGDGFYTIGTEDVAITYNTAFINNSGYAFHAKNTVWALIFTTDIDGAGASPATKGCVLFEDSTFGFMNNTGVRNCNGKSGIYALRTTYFQLFNETEHNGAPDLVLMDSIDAQVDGNASKGTFTYSVQSSVSAAQALAEKATDHFEGD
jgi:hypothetical protein